MYLTVNVYIELSRVASYYTIQTFAELYRVIQASISCSYTAISPS